MTSSCYESTHARVNGLVFPGQSAGTPRDFVMGKSMVSGHDFPLSQSIDFGIQPFGSFLQCQPQMILGKFLPTVTFIRLSYISKSFKASTRHTACYVIHMSIYLHISITCLSIISGSYRTNKKPPVLQIAAPGSSAFQVTSHKRFTNAPQAISSAVAEAPKVVVVDASSVC